ncbi:MAG: T9SS type A sorting domain-containing protein, partial [Bacteroidota bacterium]
TSSDNTFYFTRDQSFFEDVMCYYHIDSFQRYIQSLGFTTLHNYPVRVDAHGLEDTDGSGFFVRGEEAYILFGDGGVDDAEDADVIIHEYGHALSYDAIGFTPSGFEHRAVDEGFSDYIAARYSQQLSDFEWFNLFNWDGHNEFWQGRVANGIQTYPPSGTNVYDFGGIWSSVLTDLHQELGGDITDRLILQEVYSNYRGMEIGDAALLFIEADSLLYDGAHADVIQFAFCQRNLLEQGSCLSVSNGDVLDEEKQIRLFPNPTNATFYLQTEATFRELTIVIYSLTGQRVFSDRWNPASGNKELTPTLSPGIYQIQLLEQNRIVSNEKMVILGN